MSLAAFVVSSLVFSAPYDDMLKVIRAQGSAPNAKIFDIGKNDQGAAIQGYILNANAANKKEVLVVGVHHGNEVHSALVPVEMGKLVQEILKDPGHPEYKNTVGTTYHIIPVLNISGYNARRREENDARGTLRDANRDYPDACLKKQDHYLASTRLISQYIRNSKISSAVTVHGYIGTMTYPWGMFTSDYRTDDHEIFDQVTREAVIHNGYRTGTHGDIVYPASGSFEDWAYFELGVYSNLLEIARGNNPQKDAMTTLSFLNHMPSTRSSRHVMRGKCLPQSEIRRLDQGSRP